MVGFAQTSREPSLRVKFISAGLAGCMADLVTFPLDLAKVRLQIQGEGAGGVSVKMPKYRGMFGTITTILREEGARALYNGLSPGLQRQVCFCSVRIGLYDAVRNTYFNAFKASDKGGGPISLRILAGITTGAMAVMCAQPTDVVKVRMQAQTGSTRRYTGSIQAYRTIAKKEGVNGLWRGTTPNITRNAIVNATELVSYDLFKQKILSLGLLSDNMPCHFISAFCGGFVTTVMASPVDVVKTRFMNATPGTYKGAIHCAKLMYKEGGPWTFYKGFMPSFIRLGSWNIVLFVCFEQLKRGFMQLGEEHRLSERPQLVGETHMLNTGKAEDRDRQPWQRDVYFAYFSLYT